MPIDITSRVPGQVLNLSFGQNQAKALRKFVNLAMDQYGEQQSIKISLSDRTLSFSDLNGGTSGISVDANGKLRWYLGPPGGEVYRNIGDWLVAGVSTGMRARWTNITGVLTGGTATAGVWRALSLGWQVYVNEQASGQTETCTGLLEIDDGLGNILASARITLTAIDV